MPDQTDSKQEVKKNLAVGESKNFHVVRRTEKYRSAKLEYVAVYYALKTGKVLAKPTNAGEAVVPKAPSERHKAAQFVGLGVLCSVGAVASIQTGPFPLNFLVAAGITVPFVLEAAKRLRLRRSGAPSRV